ncbi:MAG: bifunctional hydroxymethylpyrimidine kinase/phosphomethylpyrimidine kinase [Spirochaetes bacterium]|nr:bifunctional hydroxymethylpyrimidine kinase/phosphomethylpyrimidine kinase [Spirochaetota bacterium]
MNVESKQYKRLLTIAGSDSGGGAGIQADLKTFSALGCFGMSVITALTAQNTHSVTGIYPVPPEFIRLQIDTIMEDIGVDAVKVGMLHSVEVIRTVATALKSYPIPYIVVDPVMVAKGGAKLLQDEAIEALRTHLLPLATVITPNLPEARVLLGMDSNPSNLSMNTPISTLEDLARQLASFGPKAVLVKGGHLQGAESPDVLYLIPENRFLHLKATRIFTQNTHGTGCTLSSAIAAFLARGLPLEEAVQSAKEYLTQALTKGARYQLGKGHGPVHHFHAFWE